MIDKMVTELLIRIMLVKKVSEGGMLTVLECMKMMLFHLLPNNKMEKIKISTIIKIKIIIILQISNTMEICKVNTIIKIKITIIML